MASNPIHHRRTKHIELDIHFVREKVAAGEVLVLHVPTAQQFADVLTKGLPTRRLMIFGPVYASSPAMLQLRLSVSDRMLSICN
jgi:hypothetical protein